MKITVTILHGLCCAGESPAADLEREFANPPAAYSDVPRRRQLAGTAWEVEVGPCCDAWFTDVCARWRNIHSSTGAQYLGNRE